jgi:hypothetical protein
MGAVRRSSFSESDNMVTLAGARSDSSPADSPGSRGSDDRSDNSHRQLIGYIGFFLPAILIVLDRLRPADGVPRWRILDSISAYYYTGAAAPFVGLLVALGLFLVTYRGYRNRYGWADRAAARTAGCAALAVALFPGIPPAGTPPLPWWTKLTCVVHYGSAVVLFLMFAVFSLWLFRLGPGGTLPPHPIPGKRWRNRIYLTCGIVILVSMAWAFFADRTNRSMFLPESLAMIAFAVSWLTKGRADKTIIRKVRALIS